MTYIYFWPIETASRDYEYKVRLASQLSSRGSIHVFARPWALSYLSLFIKNINWVGQNFNHKLKFTGGKVSEQIRKNGGSICMFDEEGGFYYPLKYADIVFKHRYKTIDPCEVDCVFSWGRKQYDHLTDLGYNAIEVGHPRFDPIVKTENSENRSILIMTNFSLLLSDKEFTDEFDDEYFPARLSETKKDFSTLLCYLAQNSDKAFDIRIHPSESLSIYKRIFQNYENVNILPREPLDVAIDRSKRVLHFNCTTALDCFSRGKRAENLSKGSSTIIADIPNALNIPLRSSWLKYPSDVKLIIKSILKVRTENKQKFILFKIKLLLQLLELIYICRIKLIGDYEVQKFGSNIFSNKKKKYKIVQY